MCTSEEFPRNFDWRILHRIYIAYLINQFSKPDLILAKLAQFALEGKIIRVASLLNIRPDLR